MTTEVATGPISISDVLAALGDTDPAKTNAGALRAILGRGSFATIQKHLDAIRQERTPVAAPAPGQTPAAPQEAVAAIWGAAWTQAQVHTLGRLEVVTEERDLLTLTTSQLRNEVAAMASEIDALTEAKKDVTATAEKEIASAQENRDAALQGEKDAKQAMEALKQAFEAFKHEAQANAVIAGKDAKNTFLTLQATIDRLTDQVGELKSLLHRPASPVAIPATKAK